jgi:hypothetical protein
MSTTKTKHKDTKLDIRISQTKKDALREIATKLDKKVSQLIMLNIDQLILLHQ